MIGKCLQSLKITFFVVIPSLFNKFAMRALGSVSCNLIAREIQAVSLR